MQIACASPYIIACIDTALHTSCNNVTEGLHDAMRTIHAHRRLRAVGMIFTLRGIEKTTKSAVILDLLHTSI